MSKNIDEMVNRFLGWKLPKDFAPDGGISFKPSEHPDFWPVGTHLFTADQAKAMFEYCLQGAEQAEQEPVAWVLPDDLRILKSGNCGEMIVYGYQRNKLADDPNEAAIPLYAAPVLTKDLTGQDLCDLEVAVGWKGDSHEFEAIIKAAIAKYKEKNRG